MYTKILIRFGELSTKKKNKMTFVRHLAKNIKTLVGVESEVLFDRIFLDYSPETLENLKYLFGIYSYSPVVEVESNIESIEKTILELIKDQEGKTFKSIVKRHDKSFPIKSDELNRQFGSLVLNNSELTVDVKTPDIKVEVEIRKDKTYVFVKRINGLGGYPTGVNGKVLHLMSGGIDSPLAAFNMMKRGIKVDYLNFITPPHTDEKTIDKVNRLVTLLNKYQGFSTVYRINYTDLMNLIGLTSNQGYKINLMRRSFYRIASKLAKDKNYQGLSNGENLGQVASQTLESIATISSQSDLPIYRPILTADKIETINKARVLGTYEISIEKANESCEIFAPDAPVTKPKEEISLNLEKELDGLLDLEKDVFGKIDVKNFNLK